MRSLITKELILLANSIIGSGNYKIEKFEYGGFPIYVGAVRLTGIGQDFILTYDDDVIGIYAREWRRDVGGVLRDCMKKNKTDCLYELYNDDFRFLLYRIPDEELTEEILSEYSDDPIRTGHISLADTRYVIIRMIPAGSSYTRKDMYIKEEMPERPEDPDEPVESTNKKQQEYKYSLFETFN